MSIKRKRSLTKSDGDMLFGKIHELDKISEKYVNLNYSEMLRIHIEKEMQMWLDEKRLNSSLFGKINVDCEWDEDLNHLKIILF